MLVSSKSEAIFLGWRVIYLPLLLVGLYLSSQFLWRGAFSFHNSIDMFWYNEYHGLRLDLSMACGIVLVNWLPWILYLATQWEWVRRIALFINILLWLCICLIEFSSALMYQEWGATLDARALSYLAFPKEALASSKSSISWGPSLFLFIILPLGCVIIKNLFSNTPQGHKIKSNMWIYSMLVGSIAFLGLRGGWGKWPLTPSDAFYSADLDHNFTAVNKTWYLIYSSIKNKGLASQNDEVLVTEFYNSYRQDQACVDSLPLELEGKNLVLIITEGWSHDVVGYLGGDGRITPFFDSLAHHSIMYDQMYASGFRTDQGVPSLLSGVPSIGSENLLNQVHKSALFPSLYGQMEAIGYQTSFVYGGDLNFANMRNYLVYQGVDHIIDQNDFSTEDATTDWGVPDHIAVNKSIQTVDKHTQPFFSTLLLLSSHTPFEVPIANDITGDDVKSKYQSSVKYSDHSLSLFFELAKSKSWYDNTVFIITSDHGSGHTNIANNVNERFKIPFIIYQSHLSTMLQNKRVSNIANQFDLAFSLSKKYTQGQSVFPFGHDIFCLSQSHAAYWGNDFAQGCISSKSECDDKSAILFFDSVASWYNKLK